MSSPPASPAAVARGPRAWWVGLAASQRRTLRVLLAGGLILVLVVSAVLARFLSVENAERNDEVTLLQAQVKGDVAAMLDQLGGCRSSPSCVATVKANATNPRLRRSGAVKILQLESPTAYSAFGASGRTRLAWTTLGELPVVQCVEVQRTGNFLSGIHVKLIEISAPIDNEGKCHKATQIEKEEEEATAAEQGAIH
ncbi:MAG: hypothetical protein ACYDHN_16955 [Solirubrobacteraceae bacterium]